MSAYEDLPNENQPAHNERAEQSVLGALLLDNDLWGKVADFLIEQDFYYGKHKLIFRAITILAQKKTPFDVVIIADVLNVGNWLEDVGGLAYLRSLTIETTTTNIIAYANIVKTKSLERLRDAAYKKNDWKQLSRIIEDLESMEKGSLLSDGRFILLSVDDMLNTPPLSWRVKKIFPTKGIVAIFGPSGSGKSFLGFDMAASIVTGREWFGYLTNPGGVVYIALEGQHGFRNRIQAYIYSRGGDSMEELKFITQSLDLLSCDVTALANSINTKNFDCPTIIIDTMNRAAPGADENSSLDMSKIIAACGYLQRTCGGLVVLIHHSGKDAGKGMRGHSSLYAALDAVIEVAGQDNPRTWKLAKAKDCESGTVHDFSLSFVHLGIDDEGDTISSCIVDGTAQRGGESVGRRKLGKWGKIALDVLTAMYELHRKNVAESGREPEAAKVSLHDWISEMKEKVTEAKRASEGRKEAIEKGYVRSDEGFVYIIPDSSSFQLEQP